MSGAPIRVLVAEDEPKLAAVLEDFLAERGYRVTTRRDGREALDSLRAEPFDVALLDIVMPQMDGLEVLRQVREKPFPPEVIMITGNGTIETAIAAIKLGAYDYLAKPYRMAEVEMLVRRAWEKRELARENALMHDRLDRADALAELSTQYAPMRAVLAVAERAARGESPVLVSGEPGTGKALLARTFHRLSSRASRAFAEVRCGSRSEGETERRLFGAEDGEPGAPSTAGVLELAVGGTLCLIEVGGLGGSAQRRLLRVMETAGFARARSHVAVDVRLVATTRRDLATAVERGEFRAELFHRVAAIHITLPPLRERAVDVPLLANGFLRRGNVDVELADDAVDALQAYRWPGNVAELGTVLDRAALLARGGVVRAADLRLGAELPWPVLAADQGPAGQTLVEVERRQIAATLARERWHQGRSARALGISSKTLYRKIREYGFERPPEARPYPVPATRASEGRA